MGHAATDARRCAAANVHQPRPRAAPHHPPRSPLRARGLSALVGAANSASKRVAAADNLSKTDITLDREMRRLSSPSARGAWTRLQISFQGGRVSAGSRSDLFSQQQLQSTIPAIFKSFPNLPKWLQTMHWMLSSHICESIGWTWLAVAGYRTQLPYVMLVWPLRTLELNLLIGRISDVVGTSWLSSGAVEVASPSPPLPIY